MDKEWEKLEKIPAWQMDQVKSDKDVILEALKERRKVHFATLMDFCSSENAESELKLQKYKGRVVHRGDIVKDDSGACAVFTEQGSSASQMTAAEVNGRYIKATRLCRTTRRRSTCSHPKVRMEDAPRLLNISQFRMSIYIYIYIWIRVRRHKMPKSWSPGRWGPQDGPTGSRTCLCAVTFGHWVAHAR